MLKILIADDHKILREGLKAILRERESFEVVGEAANGREAVSKAKKLAADVVIMDIAMPGLNGIEATRRIRRYSSRIKVVILSMYNSREYVLEALKAGAMAYLRKETASKELLQAIDKVTRGEIYLEDVHSQYVIDEFRNATQPSERSLLNNLTSREREILQMVAEGKSNKSVAGILNLSLKTVETHRQNVMKKLSAHNVVSLVKFAIRTGLVKLD